MKKRVVVTGIGGVTALGNTTDEIFEKLKGLNNAVIHMPEWEEYKGLHTKIAAPIKNFTFPSEYNRTHTRSMGPVAQMAAVATKYALEEANLLNSPLLSSGDVGIAYGSSTGSTAPVVAFTSMLTDKQIKGINATTYIKMMSHTCAVNIAIFFGVKGRIMTTCSACTSGSQAIGYAFEAIQSGHQKIMIAGGAEELCPSEAAIFDTLFATSTKNTTPTLTPSPFDKDRDGLVLGEGATTLILEEYDHAVARGAKIIAEIISFATNCDATHITNPSSEDMERVMRSALSQAELPSSEIGYINAHGTATTNGDIAETQATYRVFGSRPPVSTLKSYFGHTLGACGALETWLSIEMMKRNWFSPNLNLKEVDPKCGELNYITGKGLDVKAEYFMTNNFAFGGINTSIICRVF
jgi:3-oxoacyl-[acyl-carrier-protein] synthase II